jgi:hypothetical protein
MEEERGDSKRDEIIVSEPFSGCPCFQGQLTTRVSTFLFERKAYPTFSPHYSKGRIEQDVAGQSATELLLSLLIRYK